MIIQTHTRLGHNISHLTSNQDFNLNGIIQIHKIYLSITSQLQHDKSIWSAEAGVFESNTQNSSFLSQTDLLGTRIYSSTNTRTDLAYSQSTEIFLFLATTSFVEIFKDEKLVTANEYHPGNQQIDTLLLPGGSYPIVLRITDSQGNVREEEFFFVKIRAMLPPKDQPLYFEIGVWKN